MSIEWLGGGIGRRCERACSATQLGIKVGLGELLAKRWVVHPPQLCKVQILAPTIECLTVYKPQKQINWNGSPSNPAPLIVTFD